MRRFSVRSCLIGSLHSQWSSTSTVVSILSWTPVGCDSGCCTMLICKLQSSPLRATWQQRCLSASFRTWRDDRQLVYFRKHDAVWLISASFCCEREIRTTEARYSQRQHCCCYTPTRAVRAIIVFSLENETYPEAVSAGCNGTSRRRHCCYRPRSTTRLHPELRAVQIEYYVVTGANQDGYTVLANVLVRSITCFLFD